METKINQTAFKAIHPGSVLKAELDERQITQKEFAQQLGMRASHLNEIIKGKRSISSDLAQRLETLLGISAITWSNLQTQYDHDHIVLSQRSEAEQQAIATLDEYNKIIDIKTLLKRLDITTTSRIQQLQQLTKLLQLQPVDQMQQIVNGAFRKSSLVGNDSRMIMSWALLAHYHASQVQLTGNYNEVNNPALVTELFHIFHENTSVIQRLIKTLSRYGIAFVVEEKLDRASIDAYSFRLDQNHPAIAVTLRYNRIDNLAFSLMHELAHIINNDENHLPLVDYDSNSAIEKRANDFAANSLIPDKMWNEAPKVIMNPVRIQNQYTRWAEEHDFNKWIVLGRISYQTGMYKFKNDISREIA